MRRIERSFRREMVRQKAPHWLEPSAPLTADDLTGMAGIETVNEPFALGINQDTHTASATSKDMGDYFEVTYHFTPKGLSSDAGTLHGSKMGLIVIDDPETDDPLPPYLAEKWLKDIENRNRPEQP